MSANFIEVSMLADETQQTKTTDGLGQADARPTLLGYAVVGYLLANLVAIPLVIALSTLCGGYDKQAALQFFASVGCAGALTGFQTAARRRKAFGGGGISTEWSNFLGSPAFYGLVTIVLLGSFVLVVAGSVVTRMVAPIGPLQ